MRKSGWPHGHTDRIWSLVMYKADSQSGKREIGYAKKKTDSDRECELSLRAQCCLALIFQKTVTICFLPCTIRCWIELVSLPVWESHSCHSWLHARQNGFVGRTNCMHKAMRPTLLPHPVLSGTEWSVIVFLLFYSSQLRCTYVEALPELLSLKLKPNPHNQSGMKTNHICIV